MSKKRRRYNPMFLRNVRILERMATSLKERFIEGGMVPKAAKRATGDALKLWKVGLRTLAENDKCNSLITHVATPEHPGFEHRIYHVNENEILGVEVAEINNHFGIHEREGINDEIPQLSFVVYLEDESYVYVKHPDMVAVDKTGKAEEVN